MNYGTSLTYTTLSVQSDLILPQLQQHLVHRWTVFQQRIVDELINTHSMLLFMHFEQLLSHELISDIVHCLKTTNVMDLLENV